MTTNPAAPTPTPSTPAAPAASPSTPTTPTPTPTEPLGRRFAALLTSTGLANLGDGVVQLGAPLVALTLTRSPGQIALISAAAWLPWLLFGLAGGVVVDRTDRRRTQAIALGTRAALLAVGTWLAVTDRLSIGVLAALVLAYGITEVFADLAQTSMVPDLVPTSRLQAANGRIMAVQQVTNTFVGGPVAGGLLVLGAGWVLGVPAALAGLAALVLLRGVRGSYRPERSEPTRPLADVRDGIAYVVHHPVLRPLVLSGSAMNMANTGYMAVFLLWAVGPGSRIGLAPEHWPLLTTGFAVGAVVGSLLTERLARHLPELGLMFTCWLIGAPLLLLPVAVPTVGALAATMLLVGATITIGNTVSMSLRQRIVPTELLGRTSGAGRTLVFGLMPVGALLAGGAAERFGLAPVLIGCAAVATAAGLYPVLTVRQSMLEPA